MLPVCWKDPSGLVILVFSLVMHHINSITMIVIKSKMGGMVIGFLIMAGHTEVTYPLGYTCTFGKIQLDSLTKCG